ncbi:hypothetical protein CS542_10670 [Pedobacter sp. IW39]|nr:hypothetical protein CS542_10670 [Pedobacter sp. IW39]
MTAKIAWLNSHQVRRPLSNMLALIKIKDSGNQDAGINHFLAVSSKELDDAGYDQQAHGRESCPAF